MGLIAAPDAGLCAVEGFVSSAFWSTWCRCSAALGLGGVGVMVASLFGPSQVASRLINMLFGKGLPQTWRSAQPAALLLPVGLAVLLLTAPWRPGAALFAVLFGLGSGLTSIVGGTLPLELFGRPATGAAGMDQLGAAGGVGAGAVPVSVLAGWGTTQSALWFVIAVGVGAAGALGRSGGASAAPRALGFLLGRR